MLGGFSSGTSIVDRCDRDGTNGARPGRVRRRVRFIGRARDRNRVPDQAMMRGLDHPHRRRARRGHAPVWIAGATLIALAACVPRTGGSTNTFEGRAYTVHVGAGVTAAAPMVLMLHGGRSDGETLRRLTGFDSLADRYGVVAIYPSAPGGTWNDGRGVALADEAGRDDANYLVRLARHVAAQGPGDPDQVYAAGVSNGGGMAMRLACDRPGAVSGLAVIATKRPLALDCGVYRPIPTLFFHGTEDRIAPHEGRPTGTEGVGQRNTGRALSSEATVADWARMNRCGSATEIRRDRVAGDGTRLIIRRFGDCAAPVVGYEIVGGGHTWPGGADIERPLIRRLVGRTSREVDAGAAALRLWLGR